MSGVLLGLLTVPGSCCCALPVGPFVGAWVAHVVRSQGGNFTLLEGMMAGLKCALTATLVFALVTVPVSIQRAERVKKHGLSAEERQGVQELRKLTPLVSEQQVIDQTIAGGSPPMLALTVFIHALALFGAAGIGGAAYGGFRPRRLGYHQSGPPPPGYHHGYGPPQGVPPTYAAPGYTKGEGGYDEGGYDEGGYDEGGYDEGGYDEEPPPPDA